MLNSKNIIIALFFLIAGYFIGKLNTPVAPESNPDLNSEKIEAFKSNLTQFNNNELREYLSLKTQKEKYEKADELLGKIIMIFLADLDLKMSPLAIEFAKKSIVPKKLITPKKEDSKKSEKSENKPPEDKKENPNPNWIANEQKSTEAYSDHEKKEFLKSVVIDDLFSKLKDKKPISQSQLKNLNGSYYGKVLFNKAGQTPWDVEVEFDGYFQNTNPTANSLVKLSKNGKVFSSGTSNGSIKDFNQLGGDSSALVVEANGGDSFFQLYSNKLNDSYFGNYYEKDGSGNLVNNGTVYLTRK